jgi:ATP-binding cassette subfamily B protein
MLRIGQRASGASGAPEPQDASLSEASLLKTIHRLWPYIWPRGRRDLELRVAVVFGLLIVSKLFNAMTPYAFKWATDALAESGADALPVLGASAVGFTLLMGAIRIIAVILMQTRNAIETLSRLVMSTGAPTAIEMVLVLGVFVYQFDWRYGAVLILTLAAYFAYTTFATNWRIAIRRKMNESDTDANQKAIDSLLNYETVKYFSAEEREAARYDKSMIHYEKASTHSYVSLAVLNAGQTVIYIIGVTVMMVMCVYGIRAGKNSIGDFVLINAMMLQLAQPLNFMGTFYREVRQAIIDIETMFGILSRSPEIKDKPGAGPLVVSQGRIVFDDVQFHYDPERPILKGVSFEAAPGQTIAIVGPSGAGKSTISRLMFRFYEPQGGRITIDGQNILDVTQTSLRAAIGMVPQDTVLFNDTIGYNIRYGRWDATDDEVREAAQLAQIDGFIQRVPEGYDAQVGERGLKLSGGEKQRVAIARTILKGPPILILDEATSALDSFTEHEIQEALRRVARGRTTLVIAHRLSTVVDADEILFLDHGRIIERGRHSELLALGGHYAGMWNRQREAAEARARLIEVERAEAAAEAE